jgi:toxin ParE1/3/4
LAGLRFSRQAREDLLEIWLHVAQRDPLTADQVLDRIEARCRRLADHPQLGPARPDINPEARCLTVERWLILYRQIDNAVQVVRIVDGARDLGSLDLHPDQGP